MHLARCPPRIPKQRVVAEGWFPAEHPMLHDEACEPIRDMFRQHEFAHADKDYAQDEHEEEPWTFDDAARMVPIEERPGRRQNRLLLSAAAFVGSRTTTPGNLGFPEEIVWHSGRLVVDGVSTEV